MADANDAGAADKGTPPTDLSAKFDDLKTQFAADPSGTGKGDDEVIEDDPKVDQPADAGDDPNRDPDNGDDGDGEDDLEKDKKTPPAKPADDSDKDDKPKYRFTQHVGDGKPETYIKNVEDAYLNSSSEALKLKDRAEQAENQVNAIKATANADPEFGKKLLSLLNDPDASGADGASDVPVKPVDANPFLKDAETKWTVESEKEAKEFSDANPEVILDPKINAEVKEWMRTISNQVYQKEGRLMKSGEAMEKAYKLLGYEDKRDKKNSLVDGLKDTAAPTRPQGGKKKSASPASSKQFSNLTLDLAGKMGISKERLAKAKSK